MLCLCQSNGKYKRNSFTIFFTLSLFAEGNKGASGCWKNPHWLWKRIHHGWNHELCWLQGIRIGGRVQGGLFISYQFLFSRKPILSPIWILMSVRYVLINKISFVISLNAMDVFTVTLYVCVDITFFSKGGEGVQLSKWRWSWVTDVLHIIVGQREVPTKRKRICSGGWWHYFIQVQCWCWTLRQKEEVMKEE